MKRNEGAKAWLLYALARLVIALIRCFPVNWNMRTARFFAWVYWWLVPRHRKRARDHVRLALGDELSDAEVERISRASVSQLAMLGIDFMFLPALINEFTWTRYVRLHDMREGLRAMLDGKGALLLTSHFGNWELAGYLLALFGFDVSAIMRPLDNVYLNRYVVRTRQRTGLNLIDKRGAMTSAEGVLADGGALAFIADQNAGSKGLFVDFFGVAASTYKAIGLLAIRYDVPILVGYAYRRGGRFAFDVGVERVIYPREWAEQEDPLRWVTQTYSDALERSIRRAPEQYLWLHRRWKSRPRGEPPIEDLLLLRPGGRKEAQTRPA